MQCRQLCLVLFLSERTIGLSRYLNAARAKSQELIIRYLNGPNMVNRLESALIDLIVVQAFSDVGTRHRMLDRRRPDPDAEQHRDTVLSVMTVARRQVIDVRPQRHIEAARQTQEEQETYELHDSSSYRIISAGEQTGRAPRIHSIARSASVRRLRRTPTDVRFHLIDRLSESCRTSGIHAAPHEH